MRGLWWRRAALEAGLGCRALCGAPTLTGATRTTWIPERRIPERRIPERRAETAVKRFWELVLWGHRTCGRQDPGPGGSPALRAAGSCGGRARTRLTSWWSHGKPAAVSVSGPHLPPHAGPLQVPRPSASRLSFCRELGVVRSRGGAGRPRRWGPQTPRTHAPPPALGCPRPLGTVRACRCPRGADGWCPTPAFCGSCWPARPRPLRWGLRVEPGLL